ncbi:MAG: response regulator [Magnetococcales bacterium]|nr:response regulator [Magnetococcales bacterium]
MNVAKDKKTILIVDDAPENIDLLSGLLKAEYRLKVALNGEKALKVAAKNCPDLILLDVLMPGMDGYEVCRRLKVEPATAKIPIIFVTGKDADKTKEKEFGAVGTITKPVDPVALKALILSCT